MLLAPGYVLIPGDRTFHAGRMPIEGKPAARVLDTPDTPTIQTLVDHLNASDLGRTFTAADTLKNVMVKTRQPGSAEWELLGVGVPGDREVDLKRLEASLSPAERRPPPTDRLPSSTDRLPSRDHDASLTLISPSNGTVVSPDCASMICKVTRDGARYVGSP